MTHALPRRATLALAVSLPLSAAVPAVAAPAGPDEAARLLGPEGMRNLLLHSFPQGGGDGEMWADRLRLLLGAAFRAEAAILGEAPGLSRLQSSLSLTSLARPAALRWTEPYLLSLPGYRPGAATEEQPRVALDQHGYAMMQVLRPLRLLSLGGPETAREMMLGEVDMAALERRVGGSGF